jgi:hypothetical protein
LTFIFLIDFFSFLKHPQAETEVAMCLLLIVECAVLAQRWRSLPLFRSGAFVASRAGNAKRNKRSEMPCDNKNYFKTLQ